MIGGVRRLGSFAQLFSSFGLPWPGRGGWAGRVSTRARPVSHFRQNVTFLKWASDLVLVVL